MADKVNKYKVVSRIMQGASVVGYEINTSSEKRQINTEQMSFLVGTGMIENVKGVIYKDKLLLSGDNGFELKSLPVIRQEVPDKPESAKEAIEAKDAPVEAEKYAITKVYRQGNRVTAYEDDNGNKIPREQVQEDALANKISNVSAQHYNGKVLLRGKGVNLKDLPVVQEDEVAPGNAEGAENVPAKTKEQLAFEKFNDACAAKDFGEYTVMGSVNTDYSAVTVLKETDKKCNGIKKFIAEIKDGLQNVGLDISNTLYYEVHSTGDKDEVITDIACDMLVTGETMDISLSGTANLGMSISFILRHRPETLEMPMYEGYPWFNRLIAPKPNMIYNKYSGYTNNTLEAAKVLDHQFGEFVTKSREFAYGTEFSDRSAEYTTKNAPKYTKCYIALALAGFVKSSFSPTRTMEGLNRYYGAKDGFDSIRFEGALLAPGKGKELDRDFEGLQCLYSTTDEEKIVLNKMNKICLNAMSGSFKCLDCLGYIHFDSRFYVFKYMGTFTGHSKHEYRMALTFRMYGNDVRRISVDLGEPVGFYSTSGLYNDMQKIAADLGRVIKLRYEEEFGHGLVDPKSGTALASKEKYSITRLEHINRCREIEEVVGTYVRALASLLYDIDNMVAAKLGGDDEIAAVYYDRIMKGKSKNN